MPDIFDQIAGEAPAPDIFDEIAPEKKSLLSRVGEGISQFGRDWIEGAKTIPGVKRTIEDIQHYPEDVREGWKTIMEQPGAAAREVAGMPGVKEGIGVAETAGTLATGAASFVPALATGAGEVAKGVMARGYPQKEDFTRALQEMGKVQSSLTYQPRTETAQKIAEFATTPFKAWDEGWRSIAPKGYEDMFEFIGNTVLLGIPYLTRLADKVPALKDTTTYRMLANRERGLMPVSGEQARALFDEMKAKGYSDADLARMSNTFKQEAIRRRMATEGPQEGPKPTEAAPTMPPPVTRPQEAPRAPVVEEKPAVPPVEDELISAYREKAATSAAMPDVFDEVAPEGPQDVFDQVQPEVAAAQVEEAAHEAAISPQNKLPEPQGVSATPQEQKLYEQKGLAPEDIQRADEIMRKPLDVFDEIQAEQTSTAAAETLEDTGTYAEAINEEAKINDISVEKEAQLLAEGKYDEAMKHLIEGLEDKSVATQQHRLGMAEAEATNILREKYKATDPVTYGAEKTKLAQAVKKLREGIKEPTEAPTMTPEKARQELENKGATRIGKVDYKVIETDYGYAVQKVENGTRITIGSPMPGRGFTREDAVNRALEEAAPHFPEPKAEAIKKEEPQHEEIAAPSAEEAPGIEETRAKTQRPVFIDPTSKKEHKLILFAVDAFRTGWEWFGFEKEGKDIYYGFVHGFEDEWGSFSLSELKENRVHITTDPKDLDTIMPPVGWTKKETALAKPVDITYEKAKIGVEEPHEQRHIKESVQPEGKPVLAEPSGTPAGEQAVGHPENVSARPIGEVSGQEGRPGGRPRSEAESEEHAARPGKRTRTKRPEPIERPEQRGHAEPEREAGERHPGVGAEEGRAGKRELKPEEYNHHIEPSDEIAPTGKVAKIKANIKAIQLLKKLEAEDREATPEEKKILAQYTGWGGLSEDVFNVDFDRAAQGGSPPYWWDEKDKQKYQKWLADYGNKLHPSLKGALTKEEWDAAAKSTLNAHYTDKDVISKIWKIVERLGFKGGSTLEPAGGIGHFFGLMPKGLKDNSRLFGVELDSISGRIFKKLYPQARIQVTGFESAKGLNDNSFDLIVSNFPFGDYPVTDKKHPDYSGWHIHNYFFARAVDALRPGGMLAAITSRYTMDSLDAKVRKYIQNRADLVGAIRLPDNAFLKNAGTEVVTDILIFRKKDASRLPFNHPFNSVMDIEIGKEKVPINEYFVANPDMILGSNSLAGSMYAKNTYTVTAKAGDILANQLDEAIKKLPENIYGEGAVQPPTTEEEIAAYGEKEGTLKEKEGRFYVIEQGTYKPVEWQGDRKKLKKAGEYLKIKAAKQKLVTLSLSEDATDAEIAQAQKALNTVYDRFVSAYGHINANANKFLHDDIEFIDVSALEDVRYEFDPKTHKKIQLVEKADIFRKRTIYPFREPTSAEDIRDAINISMIYRSTIDIDYLASLLNMDKETARLQAIEKGLAFENPNTGLLEAPAEYLSGDVKTKLEIAELRAAENPIYKSNVEALKGVQPKDLTIEEISFRLGAPWIPRDVIEKFAKDELGVTLAARIVMTGDQSKWIIDERAGSYNAKNSSTWAAHNITGVDMLKASLNLKNVVVEDRVAAPELVSGYRMVKNPEKTIEAQDVQKRLKAEFINYVKGNADLAVKLEDVYNREKNRFVMREYPIPDIEHFPLASTEVKLRTTQKKGVGRGLQSSTVFAHAVGTGKTYLYITLAMELKRIRAANKAMIVVQPSTIASYQNSIKKLYPTAKALIPNDKQRKAEYRQRTMSQIATGDYDIIVVPHDWFDMLPVNPEREAAFIREQIGELEDQIIANADDRITRKELEKIKEKKEEKLGKLLASKKDKVVFFESLGVDALFVDEAHRYKRSEFYTQMGNVKGIDKASSQRSMSLLLKTQFINEKTGYKNIFLATGTPISNTLAEMWTLMRYVRPDLLKEYGIEQFDSFATIFANTKLEHEMTATGDFKIVERFSQYVNGGELLTMWRTFADIVLKEDIADQLNLPTIKGGKPELKLIPRSALIERLILQIKRERIAWENLSGREKREQRHVPLVLYGRAKQVAIDPRLINSSLPDDPGSKVNAVVNDVYETWKQTVAEKSTQLVFCDSYQSADGKFNVYHEIKKKLSMRGIPGHEIQIYNEIKNDAAKASFIADFNEGKIRVALGSTGTLGTGTNVQERLIALRHIDVPPRPMDFEQRNGRGERSGNLHKEINIVVYGVQKTLDAVGFQILLIKQKFINQLMRGDIKARTFDDPFSTDQASFEDMMAALSGNPLIKRRFELETRVKELSTLKSAYLRKQRKLQTDIKNKEDYVLYLERKAKRAAEELGNLKENFPKGITELTYEGKTYAGDDVKKGAEKLVDSIDRTLEKNHKKGVYDAIQDTVTINGQEVNIEAQPDISITTGEFNQINRWNFGYGEIEGYWSEKKRPVLLFGGTFTTGSGLVQSFEGAIRRADEQVARFNGEIEKEQKNLADLKKDKDKPFEYEGEIAEKGQELQDVTKELEKSADEDATAIKGQPQEQPPDIEEEPPDTAVNLYSGLPLPELVKLMKDIRKSVFSSALYPDMTEAEALASIPFYWAQRHPEFKKVWDIEEKREEGRRTLLKEFLMSPTKKRAGEHHEFLNLPPKKAEELFKVMVESDARNRLFTVEQLKQKGMDESQLIAYYAWSRTMENVWNRLVDLGEEITLRPYEDKPYYNALRAVYREEKSIDDAVQGMDEVQEAELRQAIRRLKPIKTTIKKLREQMGKVNYYVPRYRTVGNWTIRGYESNEPDAKVVFMKRARNRFELKILENKAKKKYPRVVSQYEPQTPEFIYQEITDVALQQFIDKALESAKKRKKIDPEDADAVREALMKAITDELNIRGFGQHKIGRVRERVIEGYQTTGGKEILIRYLSGAAGYITKVDSSWKFAKALSEIDLKKKAVLYRETETYIKDMLRNQQKADKISALGRSIAFTYYLAGNLKFAAVQMSQNFATGIPKLSQYTKQPDVKYMRAMKDVTFHRNITPEEQKALDESFNKGITEGQFTKEAALSAKSQLSKSLAKAVDIISWPSSGMEEFNRKSAFLAMFRVARKEMKLSYPDAIEKATEFVYYVHFKYGKSNLPTVARGGTVAHAALRTAYTFRAYTHNYILMLLDAAKKDAAGRRKLKIIGRSLAYLFLMGGFVSLPFLDDILDYLERKSGYNFRSEMRQRLRTWGGEYLQRFGMEGLAAVLGVDISGSLKTGVPFLSDTPINDIYGVYGNIGKKAEQSVDALLRGEYARAVEMGAPTFIENPLKAYRMWSEQATTPKGKLLFDEKGRPLMLSGPEAAGQAIGFRPERVAVGSKERRTYMNIKQWASDERDSIFTDARLAKTPADWNKIMKRIQNYNFKVLRYKGAIPLITGQMVRRGIKPRPDKSFMQYEAGLEDQGL